MDEESIIEMAEELRPIVNKKLKILRENFPYVYRPVYTYVLTQSPQAMEEGVGPFSREERADITLLYMEAISLLVPKEIETKILVEMTLEERGVYNGSL